MKIGIILAPSDALTLESDLRRPELFASRSRKRPPSFAPVAKFEFDPHQVACAMLRQRSRASARSKSFNRPLVYPSLLSVGA
jgi:hypothetical protein